MKKKEQKEAPFFARYLEEQQYPKVKTDLKGGVIPPVETMKWPSDDADEPVVPWP